MQDFFWVEGAIYRTNWMQQERNKGHETISWPHRGKPLEAGTALAV